jgi:hypothetical protein
MLDIFFLSLIAAANATLIAAVAVMLFLEEPKRLLLGYLLGALLTSLTIGFVIVFAIHDAGTEASAESTISPSVEVALGVIFLIIAFVLHGGHDQQFRERQKAKKPEVEKGPSKVEQLLGRGSAWVTFALGVVLTLPGVSYLAALHDVQELGYSTAGQVLVIIGFNLMLLLLLEVPLVGYYVAPDRTQHEVRRFQGWLSRRGRHAAVIALAAIGVFMLARGIVGYLT